MTLAIEAVANWYRRASQHSILTLIECLGAGLMVLAVGVMMATSSPGDDTDKTRSAFGGNGAAGSPFADIETVASVYGGAPVYHRSDVALQRANGTDMTLKRLGWDGDALYFPIDGGARVIRWSGAVGGMVDFLHNKAISRLGKGSHGRKISNGVIESVETTGTLEGKPAPSPLRLTDLFDRLEFTHGHNVLLLTGLARTAPIMPSIRPYVGVGFGVALPHVEVWFAGAANEERTNEYQYAGPALQFLAGAELRIGRGSYYVEYKLIWASIDAALTSGKSWSLKDLRSSWLPRWLIEPFSGLMEMPGDLWRQLRRWQRGEAAAGRLTTELTSHELVVGAGYVWPRAAAPVSGTSAD